MRERPGQILSSFLPDGITPAYAGKTYCQEFLRSFYEDHPRVCGKDKSASCKLAPRKGSPPRMRERPIVRFNEKHELRITPAYAGKTQVVMIFN